MKKKFIFITVLIGLLITTLLVVNVYSQNDYYQPLYETTGEYDNFYNYGHDKKFDRTITFNHISLKENQQAPNNGIISANDYLRTKYNFTLSTTLTEINNSISHNLRIESTANYSEITSKLYIDDVIYFDFKIRLNNYQYSINSKWDLDLKEVFDDTLFKLGRFSYETTATGDLTAYNQYFTNGLYFGYIEDNIFTDDPRCIIDDNFNLDSEILKIINENDLSGNLYYSTTKEIDNYTDNFNIVVYSLIDNKFTLYKKEFYFTSSDLYQAPDIITSYSKNLSEVNVKQNLIVNGECKLIIVSSDYFLSSRNRYELKTYEYNADFILPDDSVLTKKCHITIIDDVAPVITGPNYLVCKNKTTINYRTLTELYSAFDYREQKNTSILIDGEAFLTKVLESNNGTNARVYKLSSKDEMGNESSKNITVYFDNSITEGALLESGVREVVDLEPEAIPTETTEATPSETHQDEPTTASTTTTTPSIPASETVQETQEPTSSSSEIASSSTTTPSTTIIPLTESTQASIEPQPSETVIESTASTTTTTPSSSTSIVRESSSSRTTTPSSQTHSISPSSSIDISTSSSDIILKIKKDTPKDRDGILELLIENGVDSSNIKSISSNYFNNQDTPGLYELIVKYNDNSSDTFYIRVNDIEEKEEGFDISYIILISAGAGLVAILLIAFLLKKKRK